MNKLYNMKGYQVALLIAVYIILMCSFPRFIGGVTLISSIVMMIYFLKKRKSLTEVTKRNKIFICIGIIFLFLIGNASIAVGNNNYQQKLMAEKAKEEQKIEQDKQKKIQEKKLAEEQKRIQEEEAKKKAEEEQKKKEEELKRKQEEENKRKQEEEQRKAEEEKRQQEAAAAENNSNNNSGENTNNRENYTVYITRTGKKYHSSGCRYLRKSCYEINISNAKAQGYTPCSVCHP